MKKFELYKELAKFGSKDMIMVNGEVILQNLYLNDDWFELSDYADDEEVGNFTFQKVEHVDFKDNFEKFICDGEVIETKFSGHGRCVSRFEII